MENNCEGFENPYNIVLLNTGKDTFSVCYLIKSINRIADESDESLQRRADAHFNAAYFKCKADNIDNATKKHT